MTDEKTGDSLGRAIGDIRREAPRLPRQKPASAEGVGSARPGLEHILAGEFGGAVPVAARQSAAEQRAGKDALAQLAEERHTTSASPPATQPGSLSRPIAMAVFGLVLLFAVPFIQRQRPELAEVAATFQSQVERLGQAVDDYKKTHGNLPVSLAQFPQFPANGIEANLRDYRLRLLTDQPEFFFVREAAGGFVLLGRYRGEVWMYSEGSRRPLRRLDKQGA